MKRGKKALALLLAVSMTLSLLTVGAAAADAEQDTMSTVEQQDSGSKNVPDDPEAGPAGDPSDEPVDDPAGEPVDAPEGNPVEEPTADPDTALPAERATYVAAIGEQSYETLQTAINAANAMEAPAVIELLGDIDLGADTVTMTILAGKNVTIDFKGFTITGAADYSEGLFVNLGALTLKDSSGQKGGINCTGKTTGYGVINGDKKLTDLTGQTGTLILENIKIVSAGTGVYNKAGSTATINGCEFSGKASLLNNGIIPTIADTKMTATNIAIKSQGADTTQTHIGSITNCTIRGEGGYALQVMSLIEKVEDSVLTSGDRAVIQLPVAGTNAKPELCCLKETSVTASAGDAILLYGGTISIESGEYQAAPGKLAIANNAVAPSAVAVEISGGTFSSKVEETYLADGVVQNDNGEVGELEQVAVAEVTTADGSKTTKYETLQKAVDAAVDGDTVKLLDNIVLDACVTVANKTITLDMNQKTTTNTKDIWDEKGDIKVWSHIRVGKEGNLTITGDGTIQAKKNDCYAIDINGENAKCTIENGTFIGNISAVYVHTGALTVKGGSFSIQQKQEQYNDERFTLNCRDENYESKTASITVSGGTFEKFDPADCPAEGEHTNFCAAGYASVKDGDWYTVMPLTQAAVAQVGDAYYTTLQAAFEKAEDKATVRLLKNAEITGQITVRKDLTLDLGENTLTNAGKGYAFVVSTGKSFTLTNGTLKSDTGNGVAGVGKTTVTVAHDATIDTNGPAVFGTNNKSEEGHAVFRVYGTLISNGVGVFIQGPRNTIEIVGATIHSDYFGVYQNGSFGGGKFTIKNSTIIDKSGPGIYISNSRGNTTDKTQGYQTLTIENSSISGSSAVEVKYTNVDISGNNTELIATGTPINTVPNNNGQVSVGYALAVTHNGKFKEDDSVESADAAAGTVAIKSGNFQGLIGVQDPIGEGQTTTAAVEISGGYFNSDPGAYVVNGYAAVSNDDALYIYKVVAAEEDETPVKPAVKEPEVKTEIQGVDDSTEQAIATAAKSVEVPTLGAEAAKVSVSDGEKDAAVDAAATELSADKDNIIIYTQAYLDIVTTGYEETGGNVSVTMNITPMVQLVASTAETGDGIILENADGQTKNAVEYGEAKVLTIDDPTVVTIQLPADKFGNETVFIKHASSRGTYFYKAEAAENGTITFTSHHGFSPFTFSTTNEAVAEIGEIGYPTLKAAIDAAKDNDTIKLLKNCSETVTVSREISFKLDKSDGVRFTGKIEAGYRYSVSEKDDTYTVTYVGGGSSGGGSSSSGDYIVDVEDSKHGTVTVSPKRADKGDTVTITVKPDKGYELDELTVTDKNGDAVKLKDKGNDKFTFTMPGSKVTVEASFKRIEAEPEAPAFVDVPASAYYADAVAWAVEQGITTGTGANTFSPDLSCTRAQMVTFLWRANGSPVVNYAMSFTDVPADAYYAEAVRWAVAEGITTGTSATTFSPDATVTRAQAVTFIYRNEQAQGGGFTGSWMFPCPFTDVPADTYYFESVQWCAMEGITSGTGDNTFSPDAPCTRAQIVTFLYRDAK